MIFRQFLRPETGCAADLLGLEAAIHLVAALTLCSGLVVARAMGETLPGPAVVGVRPAMGG